MIVKLILPMSTVITAAPDKSLTLRKNEQKYHLTSRLEWEKLGRLYL
jgi:hypothetical protein